MTNDEMPSEGGSYIRDPATGALKPNVPTTPASAPTPDDPPADKKSDARRTARPSTISESEI